MNFNLKEIIGVTMVLFAIIDIFGSIPLIIELKKKAGVIQARKASITSFILMVAFLFIGEQLLAIIGIDISSFAIAGSFVIFVISMEMILGINVFKEDVPETVSIIPLAFPIIAGAGTMTTLLSLKANFHTENIIIGISINIIIVYIVLKTTHHIERFLGKTGLNIVRKSFGIILLAIAIKLFRNNAGI